MAVERGRLEGPSREAEDRSRNGFLFNPRVGFAGFSSVWPCPSLSGSGRDPNPTSGGRGRLTNPRLQASGRIENPKAPSLLLGAFSRDRPNVPPRNCQRGSPGERPPSRGSQRLDLGASPRDFSLGRFNGPFMWKVSTVRRNRPTDLLRLLKGRFSRRRTRSCRGLGGTCYGVGVPRPLGKIIGVNLARLGKRAALRQLQSFLQLESTADVRFCSLVSRFVRFFVHPTPFFPRPARRLDDRIEQRSRVRRAGVAAERAARGPELENWFDARFHGPRQRRLAGAGG
ncbi:hypothetical protein M885DRAFT_534598 [Pelagophyceae sp. CCMP2097]|nr:hypothetical protein M885DRAFT_534598 [Pelagophyceae sp. CCMP2097]